MFACWGLAAPENAQHGARRFASSTPDYSGDDENNPS
jgi:hypothetical protein